jgi:uncharacterized metal-binding protein YceD (DUF177 family)
MTADPTHEHPEFSRIVPLPRIDEPPAAISVTATEAECAALAQRFGLPTVQSLQVTATINWLPHERLSRLDGRVVARAVQECVVTLDPLPVAVDAAFVRLYTPVPLRTDTAEPAGFDAEDEEPPEYAADGRVDLGEIGAEQFALSLDPYPRRPDAEIPAEFSRAGERQVSPFAVLERLKRPH